MCCILPIMIAVIIFDQYRAWLSPELLSLRSHSALSFWSHMFKILWVAFYLSIGCYLVLLNLIMLTYLIGKIDFLLINSYKIVLNPETALFILSRYLHFEKIFTPVQCSLLQEIFISFSGTYLFSLRFRRIFFITFGLLQWHTWWLLLVSYSITN